MSGDDHCFLDEYTEAQRHFKKVKFQGYLASKLLKLEPELKLTFLFLGEYLFLLTSHLQWRFD